MRVPSLLSALLLGACSVAPPAAAPTAALREFKPSLVVIVHGLYANANHVRPLTEGLRARGFTCFAPDLRPNDGSLPIEALAQQLNDFIRREIPADAPLQLIGHSMGGLVALQYLQEPKNAARCRGLYTIATPHKGTLLANLHQGPAGRQMVAQSPFLKQLHRSQPPFPVTTFRSTNDLVIIPNSSSVLPFANNQIIPSDGHNQILSSPLLLLKLEESLKKVDSLAKNQG